MTTESKQPTARFDFDAADLVKKADAEFLALRQAIATTPEIDAILAEKSSSEATPIPDVGPDGGVVGRRGMWREEGPREKRAAGEKDAQLARWKEAEVVKKAPGGGDVGSEGKNGELMMYFCRIIIDVLLVVVGAWAGGDSFVGRLLAEAANLWERIEARERPKQQASRARLEAEAADGQRVDSVVSFPPEI